MNSDANSGKVALVTGSTRGIGAAIASRLELSGVKVWRTGRGVNDAVSNYLKVDFGDVKSTEEFLRIIAEFPIDILVNCAGINKIAPFVQVATADFDLINRVNSRAPFQVTQALIPRMRTKKWGRIVNITSIFAHVSRAERAAYSSSKGAVQGWTRALACEVAQHNILVNCLAPGFIETDLTREVVGEKGMESLASTIPMRRLGQPCEIAEAVYWLVSSSNTFLTGQDIIVDGGFTCT